MAHGHTATTSLPAQVTAQVGRLRSRGARWQQQRLQVLIQFQTLIQTFRLGLICRRLGAAKSLPLAVGQAQASAASWRGVPQSLPSVQSTRQAAQARQQWCQS